MNNWTGAGLSEAALAAIAAVARLGDADRALALEMLGGARGRGAVLPPHSGEVPTLCRLIPSRDRQAIYASPIWAGYRPVTWTVAYVLQAPGVGYLSRLLGLSLAKVGTSRPDCVTRRQADLGGEGYGAWYRGPQRYEREAGFEAFSLAPRLQLASQHPLSPVRLCAYGIEVGLPRGFSCARFEAEFNRRMLALRLQSVVDSEPGRALCAAKGLDPAQMRRFYKVKGRFKAATELTVMRPQADAGALARLCADIVIDAVLGLLPMRQTR